MTTFELPEVRRFAAELNARLNRCDNGEGMECSNLDDALKHYAGRCCEFREGVRQWAQAVFAGRIKFDPEVEGVWLDEGYRLYSRASDMLAYGQKMEVPCYELDGHAVLRSALLNLYQLLSEWVPPQPAVGPSARRGMPLDSAAAEEVRRRIEALPPLPKDWKPADSHQRSRFKWLLKWLRGGRAS